MNTLIESVHAALYKNVLMTISADAECWPLSSLTVVF